MGQPQACQNWEIALVENPPAFAVKAWDSTPARLYKGYE